MDKIKRKWGDCLKTLLSRKSLIWLLIVSILIIGITGCDKKDVNQTLLNGVNEIEKSTYELNTLKITYDEYKQKTDKYLSKNFSSFYVEGNVIYADKRLVRAITGKEYLEKDWTGISLDELKKIGEPLAQSLALHTPTFEYKSVEISKVYDASESSTTAHQKYIYVKRITQFDNKDLPIYKKYTFIKEGKTYVLLSFENIAVRNGEELKHGDRKVEFTKSI